MRRCEEGTLRVGVPARYLGIFSALAGIGCCLIMSDTARTKETGVAIDSALATCTVVASARIGPQGGALAAPAGPLDGLRVSVPAGAVETAVTFELASCTTRITVRAGRGSGTFLRLGAGKVESFLAPVRIRVRYPPRAGLPVPYRVDDNGALDLAQILELDRTEGRFDIWTFQPGIYTWIYE